MAFIPLISDKQDIAMANTWKNIEETKDLVLILAKNLVKLVEEEDLIEILKKRIEEKDVLEVNLYGYSTVYYTSDKNNYALSSDTGGLFRNTIGELGSYYETKASHLSDLFIKNPRDIVVDSNGVEYSLHELLDRCDILPLVSAYIGDNVWVSVRNVERFDFNGFYVSCNSIYLSYMPEGLSTHMIQLREHALKQYGLEKIDETTDICSKACYCEY